MHEESRSDVVSLGMGGNRASRARLTLVGLLMFLRPMLMGHNGS